MRYRTEHTDRFTVTAKLTFELVGTKQAVVAEAVGTVPKDGDAALSLPVRSGFRTDVKMTKCRSRKQERYCAALIDHCFTLSPIDVARVNFTDYSGSAAAKRKRPHTFNLKRDVSLTNRPRFS